MKALEGKKTYAGLFAALVGLGMVVADQKFGVSGLADYGPYLVAAGLGLAGYGRYASK